jgi:hypothetical protein
VRCAPSGGWIGNNFRTHILQHALEFWGREDDRPRSGAQAINGFSGQDE